MKTKQKIEWKNLSWWLKWVVVFGWIDIIITGIYFIYGFVIGVLGAL